MVKLSGKDLHWFLSTTLTDQTEAFRLTEREVSGKVSLCWSTHWAVYGGVPPVGDCTLAAAVPPLHSALAFCVVAVIGAIKN